MAFTGPNAIPGIIQVLKKPDFLMNNSVHELRK
jgi:hypothetical protein